MMDSKSVLTAAAIAGNSSGIVFSLIRSCQDTNTVCFISEDTKALVLVEWASDFKMMSDSPRIDILPPLAV